MSNRKTQGWIGWFLLIALCIVLHWVPTAASETTSSHNNTTTTNNSTSHNTNTNSHGNNNNSHNAPLEPALAVIFPWFSEIVGVIVFFILSRYLRRLPYTAVLFIIGTFMGVGAHRLERTDQLTESILMWSGINSEVLLLVFLPGLIFRDAYSLNVHLFLESINQILVFAFPMVLAGTTLTALVAFYVFPYNWTFNLSMTFGSILAATDPVAVASLLDEVGAPPRLKIHIAGESLLNDGSAVVFFAIFSGLFLLELGVDGLGTHVDLATGIELFCRMALGGACIGTVFGAGLVQILAFFKRRLSQEENVVEVTATITIAYLTYYTAEVAWGTSGVLATVFCGVTTKAFGESLVNDKELLHNFWVLVEHLLNSLIFVLGGTVWGAVIVQPPNRDGQFEARDWGYLLLLYVLVTAIRFLLFFCAFPLTRRLGLKTNWRETFFTSYGGLRGAVGIALALSLDNRVIEATEPGSLYRHFTTKVFGMVGGVALLTLVVNGLTAGPLLIHLGLSEETATRHKVLENYKRHLRREILDDVVRLLTQRRFHRVNFSIVRHHIKQLATLTRQELDDAVERHRQTVPEHMYQEPYLDRMYPFLMDDEETGEGRAVDGGGGGDGGGVGTMDKKTTYESHRLVTTSMDCEADDNDNNDNNNNSEDRDNGANAETPTEVVPLTKEQMDPLYVTMNDFLEAIPLVQPSSKREGFATVPDVSWDDIGALQSVRDELTLSVLEPIRNPEKFQALGLSLPAGVLLYGPPGCGKTLLAKAIANESGANFLSVKGPELLDKYVGESERAVRVVFERARASSPCMVFFDELDSLCPRRGSDHGGGGGVSERVVNQLLTEMDGLESRRTVFVIAATNRPELIDPAMMRPGRLDKLLYVPLPQPDDRVSILKALSGKIRLADTVNLDRIGRSERAEGYSGADCAALLREAGLAVVKESMERPPSSEQALLCIDNPHFDYAFRHVLPSVSKRDQARYEKIRDRMARARSRGTSVATADDETSTVKQEEQEEPKKHQ